MGFTINEAYTVQRFGLSLTGLYVTFKGALHIEKISDNLDPQGSFNAKSTYSIYLNRQVEELYKSDFIVTNLTLQELEAPGGVLKNIMYPKLKELLGSELDYVDD